MSPDPTTGVTPVDASPAERARDRALAVVFVVGLFVPMVAMATGVGRADATTEKRVLAEFPSIAPDEELRAAVAEEGGGDAGAWVRSIRRWPKAFEAWYDDHFAFRSALIHWHHRMFVAGLGVSPRTDVVLGKDGWLFTNASDQEQAALDQVRGLFPYSEEQLREFQTFLEQCRDWFADRGVPYYLTIAPSKPTIHAEYLPDSIVVQNPVTRLDQLRDWLAGAQERDGVAPIPFIDLRPGLLAAKAEFGALYRRTDTHWNGIGAMIASGQIVEALRPRFPALEPIDPARFEVAWRSGRGGDLAAILSLSSVLTEDLVALQSLDPIDLVREEEGLVPVRIPAIQIEFAENLAAERTTPFRMVQERDDLPRLLMFRDSYASNLVPFLSRAFSSSAYYWQYRIHDPAIMALERPDVVVQEIGERVLMRNVGMPRNEPFLTTGWTRMRAFRDAELELGRVADDARRSFRFPLDRLPDGQAVSVRIAGDFGPDASVRVRLLPPQEGHAGWVLHESELVAWRDVVYAHAEKPNSRQTILVEVAAEEARDLEVALRVVPRLNADAKASGD